MMQQKGSQILRSLRERVRAFDDGACTREEVWRTWLSGAKHYSRIVQTVATFKRSLRRQIRMFVRYTHNLLRAWGTLVLPDTQRVYLVLAQLTPKRKSTSGRQSTVRRPVVRPAVA